MAERANTFLAGPASGAAATPEYRRQVTADMPLYDTTVGAVYATTVPVPPRTYASRLAESISVKDFGATGDGTTPDHKAIQAAIDFAILNGIATVHFPDGKYLVQDTIHLGYGETFHQINLVGQRSAASAVIFSDLQFAGGVTLLPTMTDRPCLNMQGGRNCGIYGISFHYEPMWRAISATINGTEQNFPSDPAAWNVEIRRYQGTDKDVTIPIEHGLDRYRPFCAISIDAFRRPRKVPSTTPSYGPVDYPEWTGLKDPAKPISPSSRCTIEDCEIRGFCVGIITEPCGGDGNGDFVKIRNCNIGSGVYGIAICHTQSRAVEIRNCNFGYLHTSVDNSTFGLGAGTLGGGMDLCTVAMSYQVLNIGNAASGDLVVRHLHVESTVRIGLFSGGYSTWQSGLVLEACSFNFCAGTGPSNGPAEVPRAYLEVRGPAPVKFSHCGLMCNRFFFVSTGSIVLFENCRWNCGRDYISVDQLATNQSHGAEPDPAVAIGYSIFGGMHVLNRTGIHGPRIIGQCEATKFTYVPGDAVNGKPPKMIPSSQFLQPACLAASSETPSLVHPAAESYRDNEGRKWPLLHNRLPTLLHLGLESSGTFAKDPVQSGMVITGELRSQWQEKSGLYATMDPGDVLEHDGTGNVYIVTSVMPVTVNNGTIYKFTAVQQNNYSIKAGTANTTGAATPLVSLLAAKGNSLRLHKAIKLPYKVYFGDFVKGSTLVTNVHLGNGYSSQLLKDIPDGMAIAEEPFGGMSGDFAVASSNGNIRVASRMPGNDHEVSGQAILTRAASFTGRFPLFPVLLAGINVRNAGLPSKSTGTFTCSTLDPITKIANDRVTKTSRIILMPTTVNAAKLSGSGQALFVSDKVERTGFSVGTGDGKPCAYTNATFDYVVDL